MERALSRYSLRKLLQHQQRAEQIVEERIRAAFPQIVQRPAEEDRVQQKVADTIETIKRVEERCLVCINTFERAIFTAKIFLDKKSGRLSVLRKISELYLLAFPRKTVDQESCVCCLPRAVSAVDNNEFTFHFVFSFVPWYILAVIVSRL